MRRADLAKRLISAANEGERTRLLKRNRHLANVRLADEIRKACYAAWTIDPAKTRRAALAAKSLANLNKADEIRAIALWVVGISEITKAKFESAVANLDDASKIFVHIGKVNDSAQTQVAQVMALAMLGRYAEAIRTGHAALKVFVAQRDHLAAGKIEMNLSNIVSRRSLHREAERYCMSARRQFMKAGENSWKAMAENGLANTYAELNDFQKADRYYRMALETARSEKMLVTEAEIEASLGNLAMLRGLYAEALRFLELSRQKYESLGLPHQSAIADLEIADIYSELNLDAEAATIYRRVAASFRRLKLTAEEARTRLNYGRTAWAMRETSTAKRELRTAMKLFEKEKNRSGQTAALLASARLALGERDFAASQNLLEEASAASRKSENPRHAIQLAFLQGELFRKTGQYKKAIEKLSQTDELAREFRQPDAHQSARNSLGKIAALQGDLKTAKKFFKDAIRMIEDLRSSLGRDEAGMAFFGSRLEPYQNLARLLLGKKKTGEAFEVIEASRGRSLLDSTASAYRAPSRETIRLRKQLAEVRAELNFHYKRLEFAGGEDAISVRAEIARLEAKLAKTSRQIRNIEIAKMSAKKRIYQSGLQGLQNALDASTTFVEFVEFEGTISAFVITKARIDYVTDLTATSQIMSLLEELHFQFGAMRYGGKHLGKFLDILKARSDDCLLRLYDQIFRPLENHISTDRLVIAPAGVLNYVPFPALNDRHKYLIERFEISCAPSATVWTELQKRRTRNIRNAFLIGYADERIPLVEREIRDIEAFVPRPTTLLGADATFSAFIGRAGKFDLIHMACHGKFRAESPMFSSLHLADGWITVRDISSQPLRARLATLSACETGLSKIFAGEEILGLARGFLLAGVQALVVSLWTVNDASTGRFMRSFYNSLQRASSIAASVKEAQIEFIQRGEHPFYWSPFVLIGK
jgi:tetratricopeptide (TPR) repeat protein